jgi:serine/threonine-protein kinase RsbW
VTLTEAERDSRANVADVKVAAGPLAAPVFARVVAMLAARANCPLDRLEEALLVTDALAAHAPRHTEDGRIALRAEVVGGTLMLTVGPLPKDGASGLLHDADLPGLGNVLERVADALQVRSAPAGECLVAEISLRSRD